MVDVAERFVAVYIVLVGTVHDIQVEQVAIGAGYGIPCKVYARGSDIRFVDFVDCNGIELKNTAKHLECDYSVLFFDFCNRQVEIVAAPVAHGWIAVVGERRNP